MVNRPCQLRSQLGASGFTESSRLPAKVPSITMGYLAFCQPNADNCYAQIGLTSIDMSSLTAVQWRYYIHNLHAPMWMYSCQSLHCPTMSLNRLSLQRCQRLIAKLRYFPEIVLLPNGNPSERDLESFGDPGWHSTRRWPKEGSRTTSYDLPKRYTIHEQEERKMILQSHGNGMSTESKISRRFDSTDMDSS